MVFPPEPIDSPTLKLAFVMGPIVSLISVALLGNFALCPQLKSGPLTLTLSNSYFRIENVVV